MEEAPVRLLDMSILHSLSRFLGSAVAGQNTTYLPHKGVLSPAEKVLYVSYSNGAGPVSSLYFLEVWYIHASFV